MDKLKKWGILILAICTVLGLFYWNTKEQRNTTASSPIEPQVKEREEKQEESIAVMDIKGAVRQEGVYEMPAGARVKDAIEKAGGFLPEADTAKVNLAQYVHDQMLLYVPHKGEQVASAQPEEQQKIAINLATKEELEQIAGIGPKKAESIIRYREQHGPFQKAEDLLEVDGIGEKSLETIKEYIVVP